MIVDCESAIISTVWRYYNHRGIIIILPVKCCQRVSNTKLIVPIALDILLFSISGKVSTVSGWSSSFLFPLAISEYHVLLSCSIKLTSIFDDFFSSFSFISCDSSSPEVHNFLRIEWVLYFIATFSFLKLEPMPSTNRWREHIDYDPITNKDKIIDHVIREPKTLSEAVIIQEMQALSKSESWDLVPPHHQKAIGCRWIFKVKHNVDG